MRTQSLRLLLPALMGFSLAAAAQTGTKLPSQITTLDGKTYTGVAEQAEAVYPDGIVVKYQADQGGQPVTGGFAVAKIKFQNLPEDVRKQFSYDAKAAADYENQQAQGTAQWLQAQASAERSIRLYRDMALLNWSLAGDADVSYSLSLDSNGKVTAAGYTRTVPAQTITNVNIPTFTYFARQNGLVTDYVPVQTAPGTVVVTK